MDPGVRRDDTVNVSPAYRGLPRIRLQSGGFDASDRADLVIVGSIAADADRAKQDAAVLDQYAAGTGTIRPCASVFTAPMGLNLPSVATASPGPRQVNSMRLIARPS